MSENQPLFCIDNLPITQVKARSHLKKILHLMGLDPSYHNFHTFRRSGATLAFNQNIDLQRIKDHGTWSSGADFTNELKPGFGLKFRTLVLNSVKNVLSQWA